MISTNSSEARRICGLLFWGSAIISTISFAVIEDTEHVGLWGLLASIAVMVVGIMSYIIDETLKILISSE